MKLIQLNVEQDKHTKEVEKFLLDEDADIVCLEEILSSEFENLKKILKVNAVFAPLLIYKDQMQGIAIFSKTLLLYQRDECYHQKPGALYDYKDDEKIRDLYSRPLLVAKTEIFGNVFTIGLTHFPPNYPGNIVSDLQRDCYAKMKVILNEYEEMILAGDFNSPRGTEIFDSLAETYRDNIPKGATTTIDQNLHKTRGLQFVVDGLFTSKEYKVDDVRLIDGISDHLAVVAHISKA